MCAASTELSDGALSLDPLAASDAGGLAVAASDPAIWAGHPATERWRPEVFAPYFDFLLGAGGTCAIRWEGRVIGCTRVYAPPERPDARAIGFTFLVRDHWGGATNRRVKALLLAGLFAERERVWFHIAPGNLRSQTATGRLGARLVETRAVDLGMGPSETQCWVLERADWEAGARAGQVP